VLCHRLGYRLLIYDSFAGVETPPVEQQPRENAAFFGEYTASLDFVRENIRRYGEVSVCELIPGWFCDTLAKTPIHAPVRLAYIDCDLEKGTDEVLHEVVPSLVPDGVIFSEDYHISVVR
jgi:O-methyltransferase